MNTKRSPWIEEFLTTPRGIYFVRVPYTFIEEHINDHDIKNSIKNYSTASKAILNSTTNTFDFNDNGTVKLYGLIHAKFLDTDEGIKKMLKKYNQNIYPKCPRVLCHHCTCIPYGVTTKGQAESNLRMFCPNCSDVYNVVDHHLELDGAWFGSNYVKNFILTYPSVIPSEPPEVFEPRIFGFRIFQQN